MSIAFKFLNRFINPAVAAILRSRAHRLLSGRLALIEVIGRRSAQPHTFPVIYNESPATVTIRVGAPSQKVWWRNLESPSPVDLLIRGEHRPGIGHATESNGAVTVEIQLIDPELDAGPEGTSPVR